MDYSFYLFTWADYVLCWIDATSCKTATHDNYFITCIEKQNIFQITGICTEQEEGEPTSYVMTVNYPAEQGKGAQEKLEDETKGQLV